MTSRIVTVELDDSLKLVKDIFENVQFHHLLVVDSGKLAGVLSDRDLLKALSPNVGTLAETNRDTQTLDRKVHQIMTRSPTTLTDTSEITDAVSIFNIRKLSCIPIVNQYREPVGIVSWRDIMQWLGQMMVPASNSPVAYDLTKASNR